MTEPTLTEWLLEAIADDEAAARAASIGSASWRLDDLNETVCWWPPERESVIAFEREHGLPLSDEWSGQTIESAGDQIAPHIVRWDPARVLAECEAKRRIVELHTDESLAGGTCRECSHDGDFESSWVDIPCPTLRLLATVYADHPDYREEWRP